MEWIKKNRKLWHKEKGKKVNASFFRLSLVGKYNYGMANVDQADQLHLQYRIHYWLQNCKWCGAIIFWIFEYSLTNCYILYHTFYNMYGRRKPLYHYEFIQDVSLAWIKPSVYCPSRDPSKRGRSYSSRMTSTTTTSTVDTSVITRQSVTTPKRNYTLSYKSLDLYSGAL